MKKLNSVFQLAHAVIVVSDPTDREVLDSGSLICLSLLITVDYWFTRHLLSTYCVPEIKEYCELRARRPERNVSTTALEMLPPNQLSGKRSKG